MAVRAGMSLLIDFVERLINDEANTHHTKQEIQDILDQNRKEARYLELVPVKSIAEGGTVTYVTFEAPRYWTHWETSATLLDYNYATLTPATSDWMIGRWTFSSEPTRPVKILGFIYDVYGAAADLIEVRASMKSEDLQAFSGQGGSYTIAGGKSNSLRNQAAKYRAKAWVKTGTLYRSDVSIF